MDQRVTNPPAQQPDIRQNGSRKDVSGARRVLGAVWSHRWFIVAVAIAAAIGFWQAARILIGPAVAIDIVHRGDLVQTVVASGHVETPYRVEIGSQITGTVNEVLVDEGQTVAKGQPLIVLDRSELKAALVQAQGALAQAEARQRQMQELTLPSAKEALVQAQAVLLNAQQTYDRAAQFLTRALAMQPDLILADEPTGNLDSKSAEAVFALMREENLRSGSSFLSVTHNMDLARRCDRIITVVDGRIEGNPA